MTLSEFMLRNQYISGDEDSKKSFQMIGKDFCAELSKKCECIDSTYHYNKSGVACSGDHTLVMSFSNDKHIYVSFNADNICDLGVLYRTMKHPKDWTGGGNHWCGWEDLKDLSYKINDLLEE